MKRTDALVKFQVWSRDIDPTELGRMVKEYIAESNHGGWDGFSRQDMTGIRKLVEDMERYYKSSVECRPDNFKTTSNLNPL